VNEVTDDVEDVISFVMALPAIVPEVLSDIEKGGEEAVSIIEEMITNPGGAITVIDGGVKSVWADVTNGAKSVLCDIGIGNCPSRTLASSCAAVLATTSSQSTPATVAATTTANVPTTSSFVQESAVITTSGYVPAETSYFATAATLSVDKFWSWTGMCIVVFISFAVGIIVVL